MQLDNEYINHKQAEKCYEANMQAQTPTAARALTQDEILDRLFTYHNPNPDQISQMQVIRETAKLLAKIIVHNTPRSADQSAAIRKLREAVQIANASIVLNGLGL